MKALPRLLIVVALAAAALLTTTTVAFASSRLVYSDEFNGPLDATTWQNDTPWNTHYTTGELEYYDPANCTFANGMMTLKSENRSTHGYNYASGIVTSLQHTKFSYGYFEIRAKLPKGPGIWPAFWLTNDSTLEIDGLEMLGDKPTRLYQTLHRNGTQIFQGVKDGPDYAAGFHTYGIDWQPGYVRWYVDGVLTTDYEHAVPSDPMWICLNTAVGGSWPGAPTAATTFPVNYDIDYVRVYDTKPLPNTAPVAAADSYQTTGTAQLSAGAPGVLANDTDAEGDALTASLVDAPSHGTLSLSPSGSFTYRATSGFAGVDTFSYRAYDGAAYSQPVTVSIVVSAPAADKPAAEPDAYSLQADTTLTADAPGVLGNDNEPASVTAIQVEAPAHGTLALAADGSFVYHPAAGFTGADSFTYVAWDGHAVSDVCAVSLTVAPAPAPTVVTRPVVKRRTSVKYRVTGWVRLGTSVQSAVSVKPVTLAVVAERLVGQTWKPYRTARVLNPSSKYATTMRLTRGRFRIRTMVSGGNVPTGASAWTSLRVR